MRGNHPGAFDAYWDTAGDLLGVQGARALRRKGTAQRLLDGKPLPIDGRVLVRSLVQAMDGEHWRKPASDSLENWAWRATPPKANGELEVALERRIAEMGEKARWTCQMPTASGLHGPNRDRRRSIDLVYRLGAKQYTFIELKCAADTPLYAVLEILGYGIAYLLARRHNAATGRLEGPQYHVLDARHVELAILGPDWWYGYRTRGGANKQYDLAPLLDCIQTGLDTTLRDALGSKPETISLMALNHSWRPGAAIDGVAAQVVAAFHTRAASAGAAQRL